MSAKIVVRAYYRERPNIGYIRISQIKGLQPKQYQLKLYHEDKGVLELNKRFFPTHIAAIAHASLRGYSSHKWSIDEKNV